MEKRLPIALALSLLILVVWTWLNPQPERPPAQTEGEPGGAATATMTAPESAPAELAPAVGEVVADDEERTLALVFGSPGDLGYYHGTFSNRGGTMLELRAGNYFDSAGLDEAERADPEHWVRMFAPFETVDGPTRSMVLAAGSSAAALARGPLEDALWRMEEITAQGDTGGRRGVEFTLAPGGGVTFVKRFLFDPTLPRVDLELELRNDSGTVGAGPREFVFTPVVGMPANSGDTWWRMREPQAVGAGRQSATDATKATTVLPGAKDLTGAIKHPGQLRFAGTQNKYFALLMRGSDELAERTLLGAAYRRLRDEGWARENPDDAKDAWRQVAAEIKLQLYVPEAGQSAVYRYAIFAGPKDPAVMRAESPEYQQLLNEDLGWFSAISNVLLGVLGFFQSLTGNWGVAIILLTLSVRLLLFPVNRRSQTAMARYQAKMKRLQPKIDELKERFKSDTQKQRQEQAKLMQQEGAFPPLGGCAPMFLQLPVFFGLYRALGLSFDLRQAPFGLWIQDLSLPDRLLRIDLNTHLPFIGTIEYLNVLPPLMVVLWIWQQRGMPTPADEQAARMQKMMMWMPVVMGVFLYNYAAGLSLYMITQSGLGVFEQKVIKKYWPVDDTEKPKDKSKKGFMARLMDAQERQMKRAQDGRSQQGGRAARRASDSKKKNKHKGDSGSRIKSRA